MSYRKLLQVTGLALAFTFLIVISYSETLDAQRCYIIRIQPEKGKAGRSIRIDPATAEIEKGACVVWINWVTAQQVRVVFKEDGKKCKDSTDAPTGFEFAENCYLTNFLTAGGTSSLRFFEPGTFKYVVEVPGQRQATGPLRLGHGEVIGKGEIIVK
jgi:hypothetical protein